MKTIKLNGEDYTLGQPAITVGYDMKGRYVIVKAKIEIREDKLIAIQGGCFVKITEQDLSDMFTDTAANRTKLMEIISQKYTKPTPNYRVQYRERDMASKYCDVYSESQAKVTTEFWKIRPEGQILSIVGINQAVSNISIVQK